MQESRHQPKFVKTTPEGFASIFSNVAEDRKGRGNIFSPCLDGFRFSWEYHLLTGRDGLYALERDGYVVLFCNHPNKENTVMVFPEAVGSGVLTLEAFDLLTLADNNKPPCRVEWSRVVKHEENRFHRGQRRHYMDHYDYVTEKVTEDVMDWGHPMYFGDTYALANIRGFVDKNLWDKGLLKDEELEAAKSMLTTFTLRQKWSKEEEYYYALANNDALANIKGVSQEEIRDKMSLSDKAPFSDKMSFSDEEFISAQKNWESIVKQNWSKKPKYNLKNAISNGENYCRDNNIVEISLSDLGNQTIVDAAEEFVLSWANERAGQNFDPSFYNSLFERLATYETTLDGLIWQKPNGEVIGTHVWDISMLQCGPMANILMNPSLREPGLGEYLHYRTAKQLEQKGIPRFSPGASELSELGQDLFKRKISRAGETELNTLLVIPRNLKSCHLGRHDKGPPTLYEINPAKRDTPLDGLMTSLNFPLTNVSSVRLSSTRPSL